MTAVFSNSALYAYNSENQTREYQIEVITYDGDSETVYVDASDAEEAQQIAASMFEDVDYTMVQGISA